MITSKNDAVEDVRADSAPDSAPDPKRASRSDVTFDELIIINHGDDDETKTVKL